MSRFIFFTKTLWNEVPRLRHQLAHLLVGSGHKVLFLEKPYFPGQRQIQRSAASAGVQLLRHGELLHHKCRIGPIARWAHASWTKHSIAQTVQDYGLDADDVVVNFNYDYYFLRNLFPRNTIVTIINDDFINGLTKAGNRSPRFVRSSLAYAQRMTCSMSDAVLTPSIALQDQLAAYCSPELFMPWADIAYRQPSKTDGRDLILYWGVIGRRLDYPLISALAGRLAKEQPTTRLVLVGPTEDRTELQLLLRLHGNVELHGPANLDALPLERILGSIIPYLRGEPEVDAIVFPNKATQLLARGLPLLITGMPRFVEEPFVFRLDVGDAVRTIRHVANCFEDLQPTIKKFVDMNGPSARLDQFMTIVSRAQTVRSTALSKHASDVSSR